MPLYLPPNEYAQETLLEAQGFKAETFPYMMCAGSQGTTDTAAYYTAIVLYAGTTVTNLSVHVTAATTATVGSKVGLYTITPAITRVAVSADLGTAWETLGFKTHAMITPYVVPVTGVYYCAMWGDSTTVVRLAGPANAQMVLLGGFLLAGRQLTQSDLPTTGIPNVSGNLPHWFGVS